jgi:ATP-dependent Clp protease ATP-binding subunit ClpA
LHLDGIALQHRCDVPRYCWVEDMEDQQPNLFRADGSLDETCFAPDAQQTLRRCTEWLSELDRSVYLPIDLMVVLLDRGSESLHRAISRATRGVDRVEDLRDQLRTLARRVERERHDTPALWQAQFSLGFTGLLQDAARWAHDCGRKAISEADLERVVRWRAELQESASIRWAIRQLASPETAVLFDSEGSLRTDVFDPDALAALRRAARISARAGMPFLGTPHLIAAFCTSRGCLFSAAEQSGVDPRRLHDQLLRIVGTRTPPLSDFSLSRRTLTPRLARMLTAAQELAERNGTRVREFEILEAFLDDGGSSLDLVRATGVLTALQQQLREVQAQRQAELDPTAIDLSRADEPAPLSATPVLDQIGRDLSADAKAGLLNPVLGREVELQRTINVLLRGEQRNPLLTGEAGVGKTAIAVALALRIHEGTVPRRLQGMRVVEINGASLVGGTSYRGELEARIRSLLAEAENNVILFMDEAHAVFAPRTNSGQPAEVPNHFKSALASGKIAVVAATTDAEFHRWIEQDPALRRRFERIEIPELSAQVTRTILNGLVDSYQRDYEACITEEAVQAAVDYSVQFMPDQSLPDKAKKLLMDSTIAVVSDLARVTTADTAEENSRKIAAPIPIPVVKAADVAKQVALKTGIPLHRITSNWVGGLTGLDTRLAQHVPGQEAAATLVASRLVAGRLSSAGRKRPQAVFVFVGPPGSGRTRLAQGLARELYGSDKALLRLHMADFSESHSVSRLIGSPPGYVGYQDEDALVSPLRRRPSSVVLMLDFDLAHPNVQERLIRVFDEGELVDTRGMKADASHAIFVLTIAADLAGPRAGIGFGSSQSLASPDARDGLRRLRPELFDRLKGYTWEYIPFAGPDDGSLVRVLLLEKIQTLQKSLVNDYGMELRIATEMKDELIRQAGALRDIRDLERLFQQLVIEPVSAKLLRGVHGAVIVLTYGEGVMEPDLSVLESVNPSLASLQVVPERRSETGDFTVAEPVRDIP